MDLPPLWATGGTEDLGLTVNSHTPSWPTLPLCFRWSRYDNPVPTRILQANRQRRRPDLRQPFDFSDHLDRLCTDIVCRCPQLAHIDVTRLLIGMTRSRSSRRHGLQARITPLRFEGGKLLRIRRGRAYCLQRYFIDDREILYHMFFCVPRFLDQSFREKLITVFHELYHIDPTFNGDLRRYAGRCCLHSRSKRRYDEHMAALVRDYLGTRPEPELLNPLRLNCRQLLERYGRVRGAVVARPKVIPLPREKFAKTWTFPL
jgi:hypothetical protein